jgi:hypothetical protein
MVIDEQNECVDIEKPSTERAGEQGPGTLTVGSYLPLEDCDSFRRCKWKQVLGKCQGLPWKDGTLELLRRRNLTIAGRGG